MKILIALAIFFVATTSAATISDTRKAQLKVYGKECVQSTGIDGEKLKAYRTSGISEDPKFKEFLACLWQKTGALKADGTFDIDVINRDLADNTVVRNVALKCAEKTGSTPPETAYLAQKCFKANLPADYKSPW